jgi:hypothetical protein
MPNGRKRIGIVVKHTIALEALDRSPAFGDLDESDLESCRVRGDDGNIARREGLTTCAKVDLPTEVWW